MEELHPLTLFFLVVLGVLAICSCCLINTIVDATYKLCLPCSMMVSCCNNMTYDEDDESVCKCVV